MTPVQILFLAANPKDSSPLSLDQEVRSIDNALRGAEFRDHFNLEQQWAVRFNDLQGHLLRYKPNIVHFSGHGSPASEIILEDLNGNSRVVPSKALGRLFRVFKDTIKCVILNACYSEQQAKAISENIDCVIGMTQAIGDQAAINFASSFYQALAYGRSVRDAFDLGCNQIDLASLNQENVPQLLTKTGVEPQKVFFASAVAAENFAPEKLEPTPKPTPKKPEFRRVKRNKIPKDDDEEEPHFVVGNAVAENQQGLTFFSYGNYNEAIKHFDAALMINPQMADALNNKGLSYINLYVASQNPNLLKEAVKCIDAALKVNPMHVPALNNKGLALTHMSQLGHDINMLNQAISYFANAINIDPSYALAWNNKAVAENIRNQWVGYAGLG
jgi:tetratricopeptide (TPR) repeat protein